MPLKALPASKIGTTLRAGSLSPQCSLRFFFFSSFQTSLVCISFPLSLHRLIVAIYYSICSALHCQWVFTTGIGLLARRNDHDDPTARIHLQSSRCAHQNSPKHGAKLVISDVPRYQIEICVLCVLPCVGKQGTVGLSDATMTLKNATAHITG